MKALLTIPVTLRDALFTPAQLTRLRDLVDVDVDAPVSDLAGAADDALAEVEVLITGWGSPRVDADALARMPRLRAVVHTAGTVRHVVSDAVWERPGFVVTTAAEANAVPVAEFTLAQVLLAGKRTLAQEAQLRAHRGADRPALGKRVGNYGAVVGLIGASRIGQLVAGHLRRFDLEVLISDPYWDAERVAQLGARKVELDELFATSDVVSLHAPDVPSTQGLVSAELLALMRDGATFINTARPALVDEDALRFELTSGRISAVLDVHDALRPDDAMWDAPCTSITPHLAGSQGNELHRMAESALEEVRRLVAGEPPLDAVDRSRLDITA